MKREFLMSRPLRSNPITEPRHHSEQVAAGIMTPDNPLHSQGSNILAQGGEAPFIFSDVFPENSLRLFLDPSKDVAILDRKASAMALLSYCQVHRERIIETLPKGSIDLEPYISAKKLPSWLPELLIKVLS